MTPCMRSALISAAGIAALLSAPVFAGTTNTACHAQGVNQPSINSPTVGASPSVAMGQSLTSAGGKSTLGASGINAGNTKGVTGMDGRTIGGTSTQAVSYNGASVGGMGANGGNGELNLNNGGMAGAMDDSNDTGMTKINPKGGNAPQTDDHGNPMTPDGNYNYGGELTYAATNGWGGNPHDGQDSHGNTYKDGKLWNGTDGTTTMKNGVPQDGTNDGNGKHLGKYDGGKGTSEPGADTGNNSGNDGTNAAGQSVRVGNGNDAGGPGMGGGQGDSSAGMAFNGGGRVGSDAPLGQPKTIEAMNTSKLNNGVTDPCAGSMVH